MSDLLKAIREEAKKGRIVFRSIDGLHRIDENEFIKQDADGILYDLNRDEVTTATGFDEYRGVNDYAVARTIRALRKRIDELEALNQEAVKKAWAVRQITGCATIDCKEALDKVGGDIERAVAWLRRKGPQSTGNQGGPGA